MSRNPNTDPPQPEDMPDVPTTPDEPLPLPPGDDEVNRSPVREPDTPMPAGDPQPTEPTRLV